jgi:hypothetical protein
MRLIAQLGLPDNARLLDVGGYPATLADLLEDRAIITLDHPHCPRPRYLSGSATAIPLQDKSFDLILSSDTLEHLPAADRDSFLDESLRVSSRFIIIGAPFQSDPVDFCEQRISALYERCYGRPHPWLAEHIANGLPRLDEVTNFFEKHRCTYVPVPNGNLYFWFIMQSLELLLAGFPNATRLVAEFHPHANRLWAISAPATPAYRHFLVIAKNGYEIPRQIRSLAPAEPDEPLTTILEKLRALHHLVHNLYDNIEEVFADPDRKGLLLSAQYIDQLEKIVAHQEKEVLRQTQELETSQARLVALERNPVVRLLRKLRIV